MAKLKSNSIGFEKVCCSCKARGIDSKVFLKYYAFRGYANGTCKTCGKSYVEVFLK